MNKIQTVLPALCALSLLTGTGSFGQSTQPRRFEVEVGGGALQLPAPYRTGWFVGQQLTGYLHPRVGIALGLNWANSANLDPLDTRNPGENVGFTVFKPNPAQLPQFYQRQEQMTNLSAVFIPLLTPRHQFKIQAGLSAYKRREFGVERVFYPEPRDRSYYVEVPRLIDSRRILPMAAVGYDLRLSNRWAVGLNATAYFTGAERPTSTLGLRTAYRFGLLADSLDRKSFDKSELRTGVRLSANLVDRNGLIGGYRMRLAGGLWAELPVSLTWALRGEINYAQRGYRQRGQPTATTSRGSSDYLELPLLFRHEIAYHWHLYGGSYLAFFLNGYSESDGKRNEPIQPHTISGLTLGTSYTLSDRIAADLRYQTDVFLISTTPYDGFHSFQLGLTCQIGKKP